MKQISQPIQDVDVELISFHEENVYESFTNDLHLDVQEVPSIEEAITRIKAGNPLVFVPYEKGTYIRIKRREQEPVLPKRQNGSRSSA